MLDMVVLGLGVIGVARAPRRNVGHTCAAYIRDSDHAECEGVWTRLRVLLFGYVPLGKLGKNKSALFGKKFSPLRGENWSVCSPTLVVSHGTTSTPPRPPILGEIGGKAKTLTPNISSPEGDRGVLPVLQV